MEIQPRSRVTIPHRKRTDCRGEPPLPLGACRKRLWTRGPERAGSLPFFLPRSASSLRSSAPRPRWPSSEHRNRPPTPLGRYDDPREGSFVDPTLPVPLSERCGYSVGSCPAFRETRPFRGRAPIDCRRRSGADARPPDRLGRERLWRRTAPLPVFP